MRKPLASRIAGLAVLYCAVFIILIIVQFSNRGNFSLLIGAMTIRGRYMEITPSEAEETFTEEQTESYTDQDEEPAVIYISDGIKIFYGGLEFNLSEDRGKGLALNGIDGTMPVNPGYMILTGTSARFGLPGGTVLVFNSMESERGRELQIIAEFAENISEVIIPVTPRSSSLVRDSELAQLAINYSGSRYSFTGEGQELENGRISLSPENTAVSYRSRERQGVFNPADYIIARSQNYEREVAAWRDSSFTRWNSNAGALQNEDDIVAFLAQALMRGNYTAAVSAISSNFISGNAHSYRSAGYIGGMANAYRLFTSDEIANINRITQLVRERSLELLKYEHILDYLFSRNNTSLANNVIDIIQNASPEMLTADYCSGLLEFYSDMIRWRTQADSPIDHLTEQILLLISETLIRDTEKDTVLATISASANLEYSLRLGKALIFWAERNQNNEWVGIGRSLVLSALWEGGVGNGRLYNILNPSDYSPRAAWIAAPASLSDTGYWAWTVSPSIRSSIIDGNLDIAVTFPADMTHHVILRGIRPFLRLQIHGQDWRTDSQFERYDSSGWVYYPQEQILILKLRHRVTVENIRIFYRAETPAPSAPQPVQESGEDTETDSEENDGGS